MIDSIDFHDIFEYDLTSSSALRVKKQWHPRSKSEGEEVGTLSVGGYYTVGVCGKRYYVHRVVYEMHKGAIPQGFVVDHIDGNTKNNSIENLRVCKQSDNVKNAVIRKDNASGYKGVYWDKGAQKWKAQINFNKKKYNLGRYATALLAHEAYEKAASEMFGEFKKEAI